MTWLLFLAYVGYVAYQRYALGGATMDQAQIMSALTVLSITLLGPFFISYAFTRSTQLTGRTPALLLGFITSMTLSIAGYWVIWKFFGGMAETRAPMEQVLQMGVIPGLVMGTILAFDTIFRRSSTAH